jgi:prepilin-type N-terminal cleavage/methylation domain-containing protein
MQCLIKQHNGFSLLEVIIALGIFSLLFVSIISLTLGSFSFLSYGRAYMEANELAHEAVEALESISQDSWNEIVYARSAVSFVSGSWSLAGEGTVEQIDEYLRTIDFYPVYRDSNGIEVASTTIGAILDVLSKWVVIDVSWQSEKGIANSIHKTLLLSSWNSKIWKQADWQGGPSQDVFSQTDQFATSSENIDYSSSTIRLGSYYCDLDYENSDDYTYDSDIEINEQANLKMQDGKYATTSPSITNNTACQIKNMCSWVSFTEKAIKNSGQIRYQISDGSQWYFWNGESWGSADEGDINNTNEASVVNEKIKDFPKINEFFIKAYLMSNGQAQVSLDNVRISYLKNCDINEGYLISSAFKATSSIFNALKWKAATSTCDKCLIKIQVQTAPDYNGSPGVWYDYWSGPRGKDGEETDYFATSTGALISSDHNGDNWIRYKVTLQGIGTSTPILNEVKIYYR